MTISVFLVVFSMFGLLERYIGPHTSFELFRLWSALGILPVFFRLMAWGLTGH